MVRAANRDALKWLECRAGCALTNEASGLEAVDRRGIIRGQVAFENWTPNSAQAHMAVDAPIAWRSLLGGVFAYPFLERGLGLLTAVIPSTNLKSLRLARHFGFQETYRVLDGFAVGISLVLLEMRKEDCRFLRPEQKAAA